MYFHPEHMDDVPDFWIATEIIPFKGSVLYVETAGIVS
jgi:hypothetical protein